MNKRFFNQQNLTRRLRLLSVLFAMLLMPLSAWAQWETQTSIFYGVEDTGLYAKDSEDATMEYVWTYQGYPGYYGASPADLGVYINVRDNDGKSLLTPPDGFTIKKVTLNYSNLEVTEGSKIYVRAVNRTDTTTHYTDPYLMTSDGTLDIKVNDEGILSDNLCFLIFSDNDKAYSYILNSITITKIADYHLSIGDVPFTGANVNSETGAVTGMDGFYFTPAAGSTPATLTLENVNYGPSLTGIVWNGDGDLKIQYSGNNTINTRNGSELNPGNDGYCIIAKNNTSNLILSATNDASTLTLRPSNGGTPDSNNSRAAISGFSNVTLDSGWGMYYTDNYSEATATSLTAGAEVLISKGTPLNITVAGVLVTSGNASNITGDNITGTVSYDAENKILTLNGAHISGNIQRTSAEDLTVNLVGSNEITIASANDCVFVGNAATASPKLTLTTDKSAPGSLKVNGLASRGSIASGWSSSSSTFVLSSDDHPEEGDWWVQTNETDVYMDITLNRKYDLWINGRPYCDANLDPIAGAKFVPEESTLEYGYRGSYSFTSSLPALTVKIKTASAAMANIAFEPTEAVPSGTLTFKAEDSSCKLTLLESFAGFGDNDVIYEDNLVFRTITGDAGETFSVETISKPTMTGDGNNVTFNFNAGLELHYSIDYAKEGVADVTDATIPIPTSGTSASVALSGPCTVTAYTKWKNSQSANVVGKLFDFATNTVETTYSEEVTLPTIIPTLPEGITLFYNVHEDGNTAGVTSDDETGTITGYSNVGEATVNVELRYEESPDFIILNEMDGDFETLGDFTLTVVPKSLTNDMIQAIADQTYAGTALTPAIVVKDGETTLTQAENAEAEGDFTVAFSNNTNAALSTAETAPTVTITGKGNYTGTATKTFTIAAKDLASATVTVDPNQTYTYTGSAITPNVSSVSIKLTEGADAATNLTSDDYTVTGYANNTDAALATAETNAPTVTITGKGNFTGTATGTFTIAQAKLSAVTIAAIGNQTFTGSQITPGVTVTFNEKTVSTDEYNVVYGDNINAGENAGTVTLTSKNKNFVTSTDEDATTKKTATFNIVAATAAITATDQTVTFDGEEQPFANYTIANGEAVVTYYSSEEARTAKTGGTTNAPTNAAIYYVQVTQGDDNYTSAPANATFTISPKALTEGMVEQDGVSFTYSGYTPEYSVSVKDGEEYLAGDDYDCVIKQGGTEIIPVNAGSYDVVVTGKRNYTGTITKTLTITKAQLTVTPDDKTYNVGDDITLTVSYEGFVNGETETVLTTQPSASYGTADVTKPGSYEITASGGVAQNYDFIYETGTLTINRQLNVSFSTSNEWATYYGSENLAMPEGLKAYQVTAVDGSTVTIGEIGYIPANTAVLLKNVSNNNTWSNIAASAYTGATSTFASNKLIGTASDVDVSTISGGTVYVLYNNMFKRATGGTIPANRGYLVVEPSVVNVGSGAPELSISIGDENTTAISNTDFTDNTDKAGEWYSIDGVKLNGQPQKPGLYIKNGKKAFINKK